MRDAAKAVQPGRAGAVPRRADRRAGGRAPTCWSARAGIVGFFGASSIERLPTEVAITENMRRFKALSVAG